MSPSAQAHKNYAIQGTQFSLLHVKLWTHWGILLDIKRPSIYTLFAVHICLFQAEELVSLSLNKKNEFENNWLKVQVLYRKLSEFEGALVELFKAWIASIK